MICGIHNTGAVRAYNILKCRCHDCVSDHKRRAKEYYVRNRDTVRAKAAAYRAANRERANKVRREYSAKNPDKIKNQHLTTQYGITLQKYREILEKQGGVCAICLEPQKNRMLAVDHCHVGGQVRGLLCSRCNSALGNFRDNKDLLAAAIKYLK